MEIDEKNLFTPEEAAFLNELAHSARTNQERIIKGSMEMLDQAIKEHPLYILAQNLHAGKPELESSLNNVVEKIKNTKRKEIHQVALTVATMTTQISLKIKTLTKPTS